MVEGGGGSLRWFPRRAPSTPLSRGMARAAARSAFRAVAPASWFWCCRVVRRGSQPSTPAGMDEHAQGLVVGPPAAGAVVRRPPVDYAARIVSWPLPVVATPARQASAAVGGRQLVTRWRRAAGVHLVTTGKRRMKPPTSRLASGPVPAPTSSCVRCGRQYDARAHRARPPDATVAAAPPARLVTRLCRGRRWRGSEAWRAAARERTSSPASACLHARREPPCAL